MAYHFAVDTLGLRDQPFEIAGLLLKDGRHVGRDLRPIGHEGEYRMDESLLYLSRVRVG